MRRIWNVGRVWEKERIRQSRRVIMWITGCTLLLLSVLTACSSADDSGEAFVQQETVEEATENPFLGQWQTEDGTVCLDIWVDDSGISYGSISREESADAVTFWDFSGTVVKNVFVYQNAAKTYTEYDDEGMTEDQVLYTDGSGSITYKDGDLYWKDDKEDAGAEYIFTYVGEY